MKTARFSLNLVTAIAAGAIATSVQAGDWGAKAPVEQVEYTPDTWDFALAPYGWFTAMDGAISAGPIDAQFSPDFEDIFNNLDFAMFVATAAKKGNVSLYNDFIYAGVSPSGTGPNGIYDQIDMELDMFIWNSVATYKIFEDEDWFVELGGGLRFTYLATELSAHSTVLRNRPLLAAATGLPSYQNTTSVSHVWDGVAAIRLGYNISDRWMLRAYGDVGAGSSDLTWQAMVNLGYAVSDSTTVFLGYRYLDYDLTDGPVSVNMSMSGPQLGVGIKF